MPSQLKPKRMTIERIRQFARSSFTAPALAGFPAMVMN